MRHSFQVLVFTVWLVHVSISFGAPAVAERSESWAIQRLRGMTTNLQFHRDGTVKLIRFSKSIVSDKHLQFVQHFPNLEYLAVVADVTDAGLNSLQHLQKLDTLVITSPRVTDKSLAVIGDLKNLRHLFLETPRITGKGLHRLEGLTQLQTLSIESPALTDEGLESLGHLKQLEYLVLEKTQLTDQAIEHLRALKKLRFLNLAESQITGKTVGLLKSLKDLKHLTLNGTRLNQHALAGLANLQQLKCLELYNTRLSPQELDVLREQSKTRQVYPGIRQNRKRVTISPSSSRPQQLRKSSEVVSELKQQITHEATTPDFQRHIMPLLGKLGCNGRACHGSFQGQGGFRLSMFGYDFSADHKNLSERLNLKTPENSLILTKPMSDEEHGGGRRFSSGSWEHRVLLRWIQRGAPGGKSQIKKIVSLDVSPTEIHFEKSDESTTIKALATWSDGTREDVTSLTRFQTNDEAVATVSPNGRVTGHQSGDTHIIAFYDSQVVSIPVLRPYVTQTVTQSSPKHKRSGIDSHIETKLRKLGIRPSELCTDQEFLRRVSLDLIGTLPTPHEVMSFASDPSLDKRLRKIDELLEHPAYVTWWTTKLCDLTGSNAGYLGGTEMAQATATQWRAWLEYRVRENLGWDEIVAGILLAESRQPSMTYRDYIQNASRYTERKTSANFASEQDVLPHYWFRSNLGLPADKALAFGFSFLGVRLQCAQCHKHPYDQWSKQDFERFTNFFKRIKTGTAPDAAMHHHVLRTKLGVPGKLNTAALRRQSYMRIAAEGRPIPWNEVYIDRSGPKIETKLLAGDMLSFSPHEDPRNSLMQWLRTEPNRYLAKALINRIWANYFHRGMIHPTDDLNLANPSSHSDLLDELAEEFIAHQYDMKWLHKKILSSRAYQRSWRPNNTNRQDDRNFSHAHSRRLPAEVAIDAIIQATGNSRVLSEYSKSTTRKIGQHPRSYQTRSIDFSLLIFGKPLRTTNCDCERQTAPTLLQSLYLRNDEEVLGYLNRSDGWLAELRASKESRANESLITEAYYRTLSREPTQKEYAQCEQYFRESPDQMTGLRDILWTLMNTREFVTNH